MNKSYESLGSQEDETPHYNYDSDAEPPVDQVGDKLTVVKRQQVTKTILHPGDRFLGKPGKPYIVKVKLMGYFAPEKVKEVIESEEAEVEVEATETSENIDSSIKTKKVTDKHLRFAADDIGCQGETFVNHTETPIQLTLGDDRLPYGLWKAIEHMRKGERARIMIKPAYGYAYP